MAKFNGLVVTCLVALSAALVAPARAAVTEHPEYHGATSDPVSLYGPDIAFDVFRNGSRVGFHRTRFQRSGKELVVSNTFQLEVDVLFFSAFRYRYDSTARWRDGRLVHLKATVNDNGTRSFVEAAANGEGMTINNGDENLATDGPLFPTNHWNAAILSHSRVLNTLTGRINEVRIEQRGRETVATERGAVTATRYAYTGELDAEVWYDDDGRWVKLRFAGRDGSVIEYACRRCQGDVGFQVRND